MKQGRILTHGGKCHADELLGAALLQVFVYDKLNISNIIIDRIAHSDYYKLSQDEKNALHDHYDYILDISKIFDNNKFFDHHQDRTLLSTAGLIFQYLINEFNIGDKYEDLATLVAHVDLHDTGLKMADAREFAYMIEAFQINAGHGEDAFNFLYNFTLGIVRSYKKSGDDRESFILGAEHFYKINDIVIELPEYNPNAKYYLAEMQHCRSMQSYCYPAEDGTSWYLKTISKDKNNMNIPLRGPLVKDGDYEFMHEALFIAKFSSKEKLLDYIVNVLSKEYPSLGDF